MWLQSYTKYKDHSSLSCEKGSDYGTSIMRILYIAYNAVSDGRLQRDQLKASIITDTHLTLRIYKEIVKAWISLLSNSLQVLCKRLKKLL